MKWYQKFEVTSENPNLIVWTTRTASLWTLNSRDDMWVYICIYNEFYRCYTTETWGYDTIWSNWMGYNDRSPCIFVCTWSYLLNLVDKLALEFVSELIYTRGSRIIDSSNSIIGDSSNSIIPVFLRFAMYSYEESREVVLFGFHVSRARSVSGQLAWCYRAPSTRQSRQQKISLTPDSDKCISFGWKPSKIVTVFNKNWICSFRHSNVGRRLKSYSQRYWFCD